MTKQDYVALAALIKVQRTPNPGADVQEALDNLARDMAQYMARSQHFDTGKFLMAAGVQ